MTNDRLQKWLVQSALRLPWLDAPAKEADEIIRWLAGPDGAIGIADDAAWELISTECSCFTDAGYLWFETHPSSLALSEDEEDIKRAISRAMHYLAERGLLVAHPKSAGSVRHIHSRPERIGAEVSP
jgi:hypothetical protein